jgi:secreted trypsin-like serine protease
MMKPPKLDGPTVQGKRAQESKYIYIGQIVIHENEIALFYIENAGRSAIRPAKQFFSTSVSATTSASTSFSGQYPWQASLSIQKGPFSFTKTIRFCSGSLVDYNWLATSATCARYSPTYLTHFLICVLGAHYFALTEIAK